MSAWRGFKKVICHICRKKKTANLMHKNFLAPLAPNFIMTNSWCVSTEPISRTPPPPVLGALMTPLPQAEVKTRHALMPHGPPHPTQPWERLVVASDTNCSVC